MAIWAKLSRSHLRAALAVATGAAVGGLYAHFVGCATGTCPLTSSVWRGLLFGGFVGGLAGWPSRPASTPGSRPGGPGAPA